MDSFAHNWLEIQCKMITACDSALLLAVEANTAVLRPVATWPLGRDAPSELQAIARVAAKAGENQLNPVINALELDSAFDYLAAPIFIEQQLLAVVAFKIQVQSAQKQQDVFKLLEQGKRWFALANKEEQAILPKEFYTAVVKLLTICLEEDSYQQTLITLITELTRHFQCGRVAIGEMKGHNIEIVALSNSAKFDNRANLMRAIAQTMSEAVDQDRVIIYPSPAEDTQVVTLAHSELAKHYHAGAICSLPLVYQQQVFAVITLERDANNPFAAEQVRLLEQAVALIMPYLHLKKALEKSWYAQLLVAFKRHWQGFFSLRGIANKLLAMLVMIALLLANVLQGEYKVHATAALEGKIQRVVAAPMDGYILSAAARAGDSIKAGATMAVMDDADLQLEHNKLVGEQQQHLREYREARANNDLVQVSVISAKLQQIEAQLQLNQDQLQRTTLTAPFDGIVIEGDLSQLLGTPVEKGKSLFKVAPLDGYRIILNVSERLIADIKPLQTGYLALSSLPQQKLALTVQKISTTAKVEGGENSFRVEASLQAPIASLRPGMEGIAKIYAGKRTYWWIWTHELVNWLRIQLWSLWP